MNLTIERRVLNLFCVFSVIFPFLIYPWGKDFYYANIKAYYFMGFTFLLLLVNLGVARYGKLSIGRIKSIEWLLIFFLFLIGYSTLSSENISLVGKLTEHQGILIVTSYGILFSFSFRFLAPEKQVHILNLIVISSFLVAAYGIFQHFHLGFFPQDLVLNEWTRSYSLFDNPDYFGSYLDLVIIISMVFFLLAREKRKEIIHFLILCTLYIALLESETRSAWLSTAVGFMIVTISVVWKRRDLWKKWEIIVLSFFLLFGVVNEGSKQSYTNRATSIATDAQKIATNQNSGSAGASRWYIWQVSLPLIEKNIWFGTGPNTFEFVFHPDTDKNYKKYIGNSRIYDENNDYLQIALTMGVPALVTYLLFLLLVILAGFKKAKNMSGDQKVILYGLLASIIGYLVQAFFNISVVSVAPYFWMFLGFVCSERWNLKKVLKG